MRSSSALLLVVSVLISANLSAEILGRVGKVYPIQEEDFVAYMKRRTDEAVKSGEIEEERQKALARARKAFFDPEPIAGVSPALSPSTYYVDPGMIIGEDIRDHQGNLIAPAGTYINALDHMTLDYGLLFFNANDPRQKSVAKSIVDHYGKRRVKVVLVGGGPALLEKEWGMSVYYDQGGYLVDKLHLTQTPAFVTQDERRLRVDVLSVQ